MTDREQTSGESQLSMVPRTEEEWKSAMGNDGTGHCVGCGWPIDRINPECASCMRALCAFMNEEVDPNGDPF